MEGRAGEKEKKREDRIEPNPKKKGGQKLSWKKDFLAIATIHQQWWAQLLQEDNSKDYLKEDLQEFQML
jgi:hypothetical protein